MKQTDLYDMANRCGFAVSVYSDHPEFFSSWSLRIKKSESSYLLENDGRDGWLLFYKELEPNKFQEIDKKTSQAMSDSEKLNQCEAWLLTV
ncbi:hypothetical protein M5G22_28080 [Pseudomonas sp. TNT2022 ID233]|uniref:hypothetical protein n=1 Tax=Pseudomonas aphyarum TaxID=2942629 RepID=UPI002360AB5F|nr:hypothetical protein [Pseudomonas aphyarum]MDD1141432.1 hypothetical protein [Pseudomonas aphyarum]